MQARRLGPRCSWFISTYLAIRVLVRTAPPLLAMGARFTAAGLLLAAFLAARHGPGVLRVPWRRALPAALVGIVLLGCGNGGVAVAEQVVPSGLAALLVSAVPLWLVCLRAGPRPAGAYHNRGHCPWFLLASRSWRGPAVTRL